MLLEWLGARHEDAALTRAAHIMEAATVETVERGLDVTPDLGGEASTSRMGSAVAARCGG